VEAYATLIAGAGGHAFWPCLSARRWARWIIALNALFSLLYALRESVALVSAAADGGDHGLGGRGIYLTLGAACATEATQHEHSGQPGTGVAFSSSAAATVCPPPAARFTSTRSCSSSILLLGKSLEARAKRRALPRSTRSPAQARHRPPDSRRGSDGRPLEEISARRQRVILARRALSSRRTIWKPHHGG